jgi:hypothetical protein
LLVGIVICSILLSTIVSGTDAVIGKSWCYYLFAMVLGVNSQYSQFALLRDLLNLRRIILNSARTCEGLGMKCIQGLVNVNSFLIFS